VNDGHRLAEDIQQSARDPLGMGPAAEILALSAELAVG
jgi:hypothetical protein